MISDEEAITLLQDLAQKLGPYSDRLRSTCTKSFTPEFPKPLDKGFERDTTLDGGDREI